MKARTSVPSRSFSIDPGLGGTGWAWWNRRHLVTVGVITPPSAKKESDWTVRVQYIAQKMADVLLQSGGVGSKVTIYCEEMEYQASAKRAVAWKSGDLQMTVFLIGYLAARLRPCRFVLVPVRQWKGQLPKDVVQRRIVQTLGNEACIHHQIKTHAWDAVGIGLHSLGVWRG